MRDGRVIYEYNHRFWGSPKDMSKFLEGKEYCQEFSRIDGQLGGTKGLGSISYWCETFLVDVYFSSGSSSMRTAYPAAEKLESVIRAICLFGRVCFGASSQHQQRALFISVNFSNRSGVTRTFSSLVSSLETGDRFSDNLGM